MIYPVPYVEFTTLYVKFSKIKCVVFFIVLRNGERTPFDFLSKIWPRVVNIRIYFVLPFTVYYHNFYIHNSWVDILKTYSSFLRNRAEQDLDSYRLYLHHSRYFVGAAFFYSHYLILYEFLYLLCEGIIGVCCPYLVQFWSCFIYDCFGFRSCLFYSSLVLPIMNHLLCNPVVMSCVSSDLDSFYKAALGQIAEEK